MKELIPTKGTIRFDYLAYKPVKRFNLTIFDIELFDWVGHGEREEVKVVEKADIVQYAITEGGDYQKLFITIRTKDPKNDVIIVLNNEKGTAANRLKLINTAKKISEALNNEEYSIIDLHLGEGIVVTHLYPDLDLKEYKIGTKEIITGTLGIAIAIIDFKRRLDTGKGII